MAGGTHEPARGQVLIVEDDEDIRDFTRELLELEGYRARGAADGRNALEILRAPGSSESPTCVILLDLMMPRMSGEEFRAEQLQDPALADIPVVIMSGGGDAVAKAQELGVAEYLVKPISLSSLLRVVARYCACTRHE